MGKTVIIATKKGRTVEQPAATPALRAKWIELFEKNGWRVKQPKDKVAA